MKNERVGRPRPALGRHRLAQLLLDLDRIVAFGDADAVGDAQHVPIDRAARDAERVAEHDVRGLSPHARQRDERVHRRRHLAAVMLDQRPRHADAATATSRGRSRSSGSAVRARRVAFASARASG